MDCSKPGFPVHHQLLELTQTHVHRVGDAIQPSHPRSSLLLPPSIFPSIRVFSMSQFFASGSQRIGVSASASVLPMNIQNWFPLEWTGWILAVQGTLKSLLQHHKFKGTNSSALNLLHSPTLTSIHDHRENHSLDYMDLPLNHVTICVWISNMNF